MLWFFSSRKLSQDTVIEAMNSRADNFIFGNKELFYKTWEVFNEFEITDGVTGEVFRIDKLLLDRTGKKAVILDFKSGEIHNQEQILKYEKILKEIEETRKSYNENLDLMHAMNLSPDQKKQLQELDQILSNLTLAQMSGYYSDHYDKQEMYYI